MNPPKHSPDALRVLLVEDSSLLREVLGDMLDELGGVELVGQADGEAAALDRLEAKDVDLAIVDLELHQGSGFGVLRQLQLEPERYGRARAVVFSSYSHKAVKQRCTHLGAETFFDKSQGLDALLDFVQAAVPTGGPRP